MTSSVPNYTAGTTSYALDTEYTATKNGILRVMYWSSQYGWYRVTVNGNGTLLQTSATNDGLGCGYTSEGYFGATITLKKGDVWKIQKVRGNTSELLITFYPYVGEEYSTYIKY